MLTLLNYFFPLYLCDDWREGGEHAVYYWGEDYLLRVERHGNILKFRSDILRLTLASHAVYSSHKRRSVHRQKLKRWDDDADDDTQLQFQPVCPVSSCRCCPPRKSGDKVHTYIAACNEMEITSYISSRQQDSLVAVSQNPPSQPRPGVARPGFHAERRALCPLSSSRLSATSHPSDWVLFQSSRRPGIYSTAADLIRYRLQTATLGTIILGTAVVVAAVLPSRWEGTQYIPLYFKLLPRSLDKTTEQETCNLFEAREKKKHQIRWSQKMVRFSRNLSSGSQKLGSTRSQGALVSCRLASSSYPIRPPWIDSTEHTPLWSPCRTSVDHGLLRQSPSRAFILVVIDTWLVPPYFLPLQSIGRV
ncbi:uncharacterized protein BO96DRAFT_383913 [Aspergillus niger CBS 101883]|uniref:Uncharacterized protein n=2 Tax=Aspergillus niger TaxID=5061 RepID=A2R7L6_ASPNC|nr:uncharacterized protein BO96DRAFT_383913 [Aspergillus niger CBS 101883]XP_059604775.1 hypothetical protein An16g03970 [Aspergillus niger]PYH61554.1 hypothetical protein BO96DRAFT_383913 [Aspergillus niger CBS 101883]CAK46828.1 hypothetical protein An16g03970 [Aspergillus niger]